MAKKIKSINVDDRSYDSLVSLFKKYKGSESISSFLDRCIKDMEAYVLEMEKYLKGTDHFEDIMKNVIDKTVRECIIRKPSSLYHDEHGLNIMYGPPTIQPMMEIVGMDDMQTTKEMEDDFAQETEERYRDNEIQFWKDDYEAGQQGIPRSFVKFINTGEFVLSRDKKFLIEKETGDRYMDLGGVRIVKVSKNMVIR